MEILTKIANGFQPPTIFTKSSILDAWQGSEYASLDAIFYDLSKEQQVVCKTPYYVLLLFLLKLYK